ncbi:MAG: hypothetical protein HY727_03110 [Candidatus Rokubacteria bacterium]|nr:hypothetical protein [Candidatus Rokubacteria bacterium]
MGDKAVFTAALVGALLSLFVSGAGVAQPSLERARRQPIVEGESAAGIRLGDSEDAVVAALGGPPLRSERLIGGTREDLVYELGEPSGDWDITIRVTFTTAEMGAEAIQLIITRRPSAAPPYLGRTTRGYQPGQPIESARALYGSPDSVILASSRSAALWWYREAGIVFLPGETVGHDRNETRFIVLHPFLSPDDLGRLVADR